MSAGALHVTERDWQGFVMATARLAGWRCYHTLDSRGSEPGFPDIIAVRADQLLAWELKTENGKVTAAQQGWIEALAAVTTIDARILRPSDQPLVIDRLTKQAARPT